MIDAMAHETPAAPARQRRPWVPLGVALVILGLLGGVAGGVALAAQVGGDLVRAFSADPQVTPVQLDLDLDEGTYIVYEYTGSARSSGPITTESFRGLTVAVGDVTVTAPDGSDVPLSVPRFDETLTRGSSTYTGAVRFETEDDGVYRISVTTPDTRILVAPSLTSMFTGSIVWIALLCLSGIVFAVGVVLLVVGLVRRAPTPVTTVQSPAVATPAGWYADPHGLAALRWWDGHAWTDHVH